MHKFLYIPVLLVIFCLFGCTHHRVTSTVNVSTCATRVKTMNRYSVNMVENAESVSAGLESYLPEVFAADGIPISLNASNIVNESSCVWIFTVMTCGLSPVITTRHIHTKCTISFESPDIPEKSFETCTRIGMAVSGLPLPFPLLFFNRAPALCFNSEKVWSCSDNVSFSSDCDSAFRESVAYGIANKLKELEDAGFVSLGVKARQWAKSAVDGDISGKVVGWVGEDQTPVPFSIDKLECDTKRDFSYAFVLSKDGGEKVFVSDYGSIRSAFMTAIRTHYAKEHKGVNPRTLTVDFPKYRVDGNRISGVAVILNISPQSVLYDSTTRRGRLVAKIDQNQFEDVRRWMRKNIESIALMSNIVRKGDDIPVHARFYIGREQLDENGVFMVEFKTE